MTTASEVTRRTIHVGVSECRVASHVLVKPPVDQTCVAKVVQVLAARALTTIARRRVARQALCGWMGRCPMGSEWLGRKNQEKNGRHSESVDVQGLTCRKITLARNKVRAVPMFYILFVAVDSKASEG
jgi:hypothetical protein